MRCARFLVTMFALLPALLRPAAEAGQPGGYLRIGVGARAAALGDAAAALSEGPDAAYWNPAALALARRPALASSLSVLSLGRQYTSAGLLLAWDPAQAPPERGFPMEHRNGLGAWAISWLGFSLGDDFEGRRDDTSSFYKFGDRQSAYILSHGRPLTSWLALGAGLRRYERVLETFQANGQGVDLAALLLLGPQVRLGVAASELFAQQTWSTGYQEKLPVVLRSSLSARLWQRLLLAGQLSAVEGRSWQPNLGLEWEAIKGVSARAGWRGDALSAGAGLSLNLKTLRLALDYAYSQDPLGVGDAQRMDISIYF